MVKKAFVPDTRKPIPAELLAARDRAIPILIAPKLDVLFCGINPGLYSGATGHHFARPGNRFWPALFAGGFTPRLLKPYEERELLKYRLGITNFVNRTTATAAELSEEEIVAGTKMLTRTVKRYHPRVLAVLGVTTYRVGFKTPKAKLGLQPEKIGATSIWVLPNPSGLNAHFTVASLGKLFAEVRASLQSPWRGTYNSEQ